MAGAENMPSDGHPKLFVRQLVFLAGPVNPLPDDPFQTAVFFAYKTNRRLFAFPGRLTGNMDQLADGIALGGNTAEQ